MRRREWVIAAAGLLTGLLLLLLWLSPRVVDQQPQGQALSAYEPIVIELNRPLRPETVSGRFELEPAVDGQLRVDDRQIIFQPSEPFGYGQSYTATLRPGAAGLNRLPMLRGAHWNFEVLPPRLLYLRDDGGAAQLWRVDASGRSEQLTDDPAGVWDFAPLPGGEGVVYSTPGEDGAMDLALLTSGGQSQALLDCTAAVCRSPAAQPGGQLLAYERQPLDANMDSAELWLLDRATGETSPLPVPGDLAAAGFSAPLGRYPNWSPDGRRLAYYRPDANLVVIQDLAAGNGTVITIPANLESMTGWSPDGRQLAYTELAFGQIAAGDTQPHEHVDEAGQVISHTRPSLYQHVVVADIDARQTTDLSAGLELDEGRPAWHPEGDRLAIARTATGEGRQIWLVPLDGGQPEQLTDDPYFDHTALAWSPDGCCLAYMRVPRATGAAPPTLMRLDLQTSQTQTIAEGAFLPTWWP